MDQRVPASELMGLLSDLNSVVVIGEHAVHELAKTFTSHRAGAEDRAAALCSYVRDFVDAAVPVIMENWTLLIHEARHVVGEAGPPEIFLADSYREFLRARLDELVAKTVNPAIRAELAFRVAASQARTASIKTVLARETRLALHLRTIGAGELKKWIDAETTGPLGLQALQINLQDLYRHNPPAELLEVSRLLLDRPRYRVSRGMTRTTLYSLWRCANFGTVPKDFNDDTVHLTNASYCDFFVTADPQHAQQRAEVFDMCQLILSAKSNDLLQWLPQQILGFSGPTKS